MHTMRCAVFETCSHDHTHYGTPFFRPSAYKVRVGSVSPRCEIEQIRAGSIGLLGPFSKPTIFSKGEVRPSTIIFSKH